MIKKTLNWLETSKFAYTAVVAYLFGTLFFGSILYAGYSWGILNSMPVGMLVFSWLGIPTLVVISINGYDAIVKLKNESN